jgi:outer membrane protein TolC
LDAAKEAQLKLSLQERDEKIANANKAAGDANEKAALAQLELARLTGPPYLVPVIHGTANPDLSRGTKQLVLLTSDTQINLPKLPEGKSLTWTLILAQDEVGQHQFTFSPQISGFGNTLFSPGHSKWLVNLLTDSSGTVNVGLGGTFAPAPKGHDSRQ